LPFVSPYLKLQKRSLAEKHEEENDIELKTSPLQEEWFSSLGTRIIHAPKVPDYSHYLNPESDAHQRRNSGYFMVTAGAVPFAYGVKEIVGTFLDSMNASADILASSNIEVDLSTIPEGGSTLVKYRGKPLFIRHRTPEEIEIAQTVALGELRDPEPDEKRVLNPKWLILIGICTHLGCIPLIGQGDYNGWFCPCHGSHYDLSGRIRKGPAPLNLAIPPYKFLSDDHLLVGSSA